MTPCVHHATGHVLIRNPDVSMKVYHFDHWRVHKSIFECHRVWLQHFCSLQSKNAFAQELELSVKHATCYFRQGSAVPVGEAEAV